MHNCEVLFRVLFISAIKSTYTICQIIEYHPFVLVCPEFNVIVFNLLCVITYGFIRDKFILMQINPTMNGEGNSVLIWVRTRRTLLGDKGKPLSGDQGMRTDKHRQKI